MKANELMIGDWVCTEHDAIPRQIDWIRTGEVGLLWNKVVTPPYLVPIPLTPEILEKNGFEKLGYEGWEFDSEEETRRDCPNYQIIWRRDYPSPHNTNLKITSFIAGIGNFRSFNIKFVHELQHALRICKIEKEIVL